MAGVTLKPALALGGWVAFLPTGTGEAMVMGDLVLLDAEVNPVMAALQSGGVEQTALHNHLLNETPHVMYMHISAHGDPVKIASAVRAALATSATPLRAPAAAAPPSAVDLDTTALARALGAVGRLNGVVYQVSVSRSEAISEMGQQLPPSMGVATAINQPTGGGKAAITGDFVLRGNEVNPVIRALEKNGHRGCRRAQPHARRGAAPVLHALLGQRRRHEARAGCAKRSIKRRRSDSRRLLAVWPARRDILSYPAAQRSTHVLHDTDHDRRAGGTHDGYGLDHRGLPV